MMSPSSRPSIPARLDRDEVANQYGSQKDEEDDARAAQRRVHAMTLAASRGRREVALASRHVADDRPPRARP